MEVTFDGDWTSPRLRMWLDAGPLDPSALGTPAPLDPREHLIRAEADAFSPNTVSGARAPSFMTRSAWADWAHDENEVVESGSCVA